MHNVFPRNWRNCIQRELDSRLVNTAVGNPLFVYWKWITPRFLRGNKEMCFMFAKAINPQVEAAPGSRRLLAWLSPALTEAVAQFLEESQQNCWANGWYCARRISLQPVPTVRPLIYSSVSNGKCVQAGKGRSPWQHVQLFPLERKLEAILDTSYWLRNVSRTWKPAQTVFCHDWQR